MKISLLSTALAAVLGLALCGTAVNAQTTNAPAATTTTMAPAPMAATPKAKSSYTSYPKGATITSISDTSVVLNTSKGPLTLAIDAKTTIQVNKKKAAVTDFAAGDAVTGSYVTNADGTLTAHSLRKKKVAAAMAAPAAQ
jgi:hypothetical protein